MAATLGGIVIPSSIVWADRNEYSGVAQTAVRTLGGKMVLFPLGLTGGRPITLTSLEDQGCVTLAVVESLQQLSEAAGVAYLLDIEGKSFNVVFRHEEPPAFSATPIIARSVPLAGDMFQITIKLLTV